MPSSSIAVGKVSWEDKSSIPPARGHFLILSNQTVLVGRDGARNHVAFADPVVSRSQLEIFSVVVDEQLTHPPLVFVRDRGSSNGTAVNGQIIGKGPKVSPARLLEDGDTITVGSHTSVALVYTQVLGAPPSYTLSRLQRQEVELFKHRYIITDRTVGDGAHAVVFLATEVETGRHVVCKVHDISKFARTSKEVERIRQEATLLSTLDHPNILPIKAAFETEQTIYVITDLATGGDLFSLLLRYNRLAEWGIRSIIRQVLRGLAYLHSKGVAHRDIKPENVLCGVTPQVPYRIMISDFGDSSIAKNGRMKSTVGTRFYRPPECNTSSQTYDLSVDIWAVGMLTLQLFLGYEELPGLDSVAFSSQGEIDDYLGAIFADLAPLGRISDPARRFIRSCLAFDSGRRPTARQAFYHDWLQAPKSDRETFKRLEADNAHSWQPQRVKFPVIEDLRTLSASMGGASIHLDGKGPGFARGWVSPHFVIRGEAGADAGADAVVEGRPSTLRPTGPDAVEREQLHSKLKRRSIAGGTRTCKRQRLYTS